MNKIFEQMGEKKFVKLCFWWFIANDALNGILTYVKVKDPKTVQDVLTKMTPMIPPDQRQQLTNPDLLVEFTGVIVPALLFSMTLIGIFHLFVYIMYLKKKKFAKTYLIAFGAVAGIAMTYSGVTGGGLLSLIQGLGYCFMAYGLVIFLQNEPAPKKKKAQ